MDDGRWSTVLGRAYHATTRVVAALADDDFARGTRTAWTVRELLLHQLLDAQRSLVALASPTEAPADVDDVTYWDAFQPSAGDGGAEHARFVRVAASAYATPASLVGPWTTTSAAVARAAAAIAPDTRVATQGHVITADHLASTLVVEATVHLLDLTVEVAGEPDPDALTRTRGVLERRQGAPFPPSWSDTTAILTSTGRRPLTAADRTDAGTLADRWPLLG